MKAGSMSKLDTLIAELCPDGVEYRNLYDVAHFDRGQVITAKDAVDGGVPVIAGGQKPAYYHNVSNRPAGTIAVAGSGAYAGHVSMWDTPIWLSDAFSVAPNDELELSSAFLYQLLKSNQNWIYAKKKGSGVPHVHGADLSRLEIPVPPIEIQREIAHILDAFTELADSLSEELVCRKQQYEYYRDRLLSPGSLVGFDSGSVVMRRLGDLFEFKNGISKDKDSFGHGVPIVNYVDSYKRSSFISVDIFGRVDATEDEQRRYSVKRGDVFFTRTSETRNEIGLASVCLEDIPKAVFSGFVLRVRPKTQSLIPEFCAYCFRTYESRKQIIRFSTMTTRAHTNGGSLSKVEIPVPSLETQQKVVDILDRFDALTTSLTDGLPAEIEARRAQYEYYRDRLLDFPRKEVAAS